MSYTASPKHLKWKDLSNRHQIIRESLESRLKIFFTGDKPTPPAAIVGPYGSGKTELMFWGFKYTWNELKRPAFYLNLESLLGMLPEDFSAGFLYEQISDIVKHQIDALREELEGGQRASKLCLPGLEKEESLSDYFMQVGVSIEGVAEAAQQDEVVLFIDEMEQHYKELRERMKTSDLSPLRSFLEKVEQRKQKPRYYVVMGFALGSAYEAIGGAEARRKNTIPIPLPEPEEFAKLAENEKFKNLLWWVSRGRPGWAIQIWDSWGKHIEEAQRIDDEIIRRFFNERIEGLPYVDASKINEVISEDNSRALKPLILEVKPVAKNLFVKPSTEAILNSLGFRYVLVSDCLLPVEQLLEALMTDMKRMQTKYRPNWMIIRNYFRRVLVAMSDSNRLGFGGWKSESDAFAMAAIAPILLILHDLILEFEADTEEGKQTWSFLHDLITELKATDENPNISKINTSFGETKRLFRSFYSETEVAYVQPSFKVVEELFPRLVVKPILILSENAKKDIESQRNHLEGAVESSGVFLEQPIMVDDVLVRFIFVPSSICSSKLHDTHLSLMKRDAYLPFEHVIVILNLQQGDVFPIDSSKNPELRIMEELGKLTVTQLEDRQLGDIIASLWHNLLVSGETFPQDVLKILETLQISGKVTKNTRRTIEYYTDLIRDRLNALAKITADRYRSVASKVFPYKASDFPEQRIADAMDKIKDARASEQVALAFDLFLETGKAMDTLRNLKQMKQLLERTKPPHGYKEFLADYTISQRPPRPSATMQQIIDFVKRYNSFGKLREYAKDMPYDINVSSDWMNLTEVIADSPLERMFAWSLQSKTFLRGLYLRAYLENHKDDILRQVSNLTSVLSDTESRLKLLLEDINTFNKAIGASVLSQRNIKEIIKELERVDHVLKGAQEFSPVALYITYRFLGAAIEEVEEKRQRWAGTTGIEAWKSKFSDILKLQDYVDEMKCRLEAVYQTNREFKENEIGKLEVVLESEVKKKLKTALNEVVSELRSSTYELGEPLPDLDLDKFEKAQRDVEQYAADTETKSQKIDAICELLSNLHKKLGALYKVMIQ